MLLKEYYQSMHGKIDTRMGKAFAPIVEVDDKQMIKYKADDGESKEMPASSAKSMPMDHPAKIEYDKLAGDDDGAAKKSVNIFDEPPAEPEPSAEPSSEPSAEPSAEPSVPGDVEVDDYQEKLDQYEGPYSDGAEVHTQWEKATTEIWGELNSEEYKDDPDDPLNQESSSEWFDTVGDEVLGLSQVHFSDFGEELKSASPEARAYFAERELPPTSSSEESPEGMSDEELDDAMQQATDDYDELRDTPEGQAAYDKLIGLEGEKKRRRSEESIVPKGSFRKVQEQWVRDNLNVL